MNSDDRKTFINCLIGCAEIIGKELSDNAILIYWNSLKHLEIGVVSDAFNRHVVNPDNGQFMPKPADIIRLCQGSNLDSAMCAWSKVLNAMQSIGRYDSVVFDDPVIMNTIQDMGGWIKLCGINTEEIPFKASEFEKRYKGYKTMGRKDYPRKLIGISESSNGTNGKKIEPPVLIGNKEKAMLVYKQGCNSNNIELTPLSDHLLNQLPNKAISNRS